MRRLIARFVALGVFCTVPGCATFHLSEQIGVLPIQKQRRVTEETLAVGEFTFEPQGSNDTEVSSFDMLKWQGLVASGFDQANIFAKVIRHSGDEAPPEADYVLDGRITSFRFQKNWVPVFFPLHLGLSFFTFSIYTLAGGPTTATVVRFAVDFELRRSDTGEVLTSFHKNYRSSRAVNIYSKAIENPYNNPNLVFGKILESAVIHIAATLPDHPVPSNEPSHSPPLVNGDTLDGPSTAENKIAPME